MKWNMDGGPSITEWGGVQKQIQLMQTWEGCLPLYCEKGVLEEVKMEMENKGVWSSLMYKHVQILKDLKLEQKESQQNVLSVKHILTIQCQHVIRYGSNSQLYLSRQHITFNICFLQVPVSTAGKDYIQSAVAYQMLGITVRCLIASLLFDILSREVKIIRRKEGEVLVV